MIQMPYDQIIQKILQNSSVTQSEIEGKIKAKTDQLAGLISKEGAAHIVANELGIKLFEAAGKVKIGQIYAGMKSIETTGKVTKVYSISTFKTGEREGKVGSLLFGDDSGMIRLVFWNKMTEEMEKIKEEDILLLKDVYPRDNKGRLELHINDSSSITINPEGVSIGDVKTLKVERRKISELKENDSVELLGTIVQVYEPRFFEVCPDCGKRIRPKDEGFACEEHGSVKPSFSYVLSLFLDDGTESMRTVLWKQQTQELLKKSNEEILKYKDNIESFDPVKTELLGTIIKVDGRVVKNSMFERMEFFTQHVVVNPDPEEELKRLDSTQAAESSNNA